MSAFAEPSFDPSPGALGHVRQDAPAHRDVAIASVRIQIGIEPLRKINRDRPVTGEDVPVFERRAPGLDLDANAAVARTGAETRELACGDNAAVTRIHIETSVD